MALHSKSYNLAYARSNSLSLLSSSKFVKLINFDMISEFRRIYFLFYFNSKGQPCINPRANYFSCVPLDHWHGKLHRNPARREFFYYASALLALCQSLTTVTIIKRRTCKTKMRSKKEMLKLEIND